MFQKRHYEKIAKVLGRTKANEKVIKAFIKMFRGDNLNFNPDKFWKAIFKAADREYLLDSW